MVEYSWIDSDGQQPVSNINAGYQILEKAKDKDIKDIDIYIEDRICEFGDYH